MPSEKLAYPIAILSDVCANLEALEAVLADIKTQNVKCILCLGDSVCYGPNPAECLDVLRDTVNVYLLGRSETAMLEIIYKNLPTHPNRKNPYDWALECLKSLPEPDKNRPKRMEWLSSRPDSFRFNNTAFTHSIPEVMGLKFSEEIAHGTYNGSLRKYMRSADLLALGGDHTPWYACLDGPKMIFVTKNSKIKISTLFPLAVEVGSVGQPRDKNPRASYVVISNEFLEWRRVEYHIEKTAKKILANPKLSAVSAKRLYIGA